MSNLEVTENREEAFAELMSQLKSATTPSAISHVQTRINRLLNNIREESEERIAQSAKVAWEQGVVNSDTLEWAGKDLEFQLKVFARKVYEYHGNNYNEEYPMQFNSDYVANSKIVFFNGEVRAKGSEEYSSSRS